MNWQCYSTYNNNKKINYKQCNLYTITWKSQLNKSHSKNNESNLRQQSNLRLYSTLCSLIIKEKQEIKKNWIAVDRNKDYKN